MARRYFSYNADTHTFDQVRRFVVLLAWRRPTSRYNDGRYLRATETKTYFSQRGKQLLDTSTINYISRTHRRAYFSPTGGYISKQGGRNTSRYRRTQRKSCCSAAYFATRRWHGYFSIERCKRSSRITAARFSIQAGRILHGRKE